MKNTFPLKMLLSMLICVFIAVIGLYLSYVTGLGVWFYIGVLFVSFVAHFVIMFITAPIVRMVFRKSFNYNSLWFRPKSFETKLYKSLRVKKWKNRVLTYDSTEYLSDKHSYLEIINNMCHAEIVHEFIFVASYLSIFLGVFFDHYLVFIISSVVLSFFHLLFIFIQRYNRPRVVNLYNKQRNHQRFDGK